MNQDEADMNQDEIERQADEFFATKLMKTVKVSNNDCFGCRAKRKKRKKRGLPC